MFICFCCMKAPLYPSVLETLLGNNNPKKKPKPLVKSWRFLPSRIVSAKRVNRYMLSYFKYYHHSKEMTRVYDSKYGSTIVFYVIEFGTFEQFKRLVECFKQSRTDIEIDSFVELQPGALHLPLAYKDSSETDKRWQKHQDHLEHAKGQDLHGVVVGLCWGDFVVKLLSKGLKGIHVIATRDQVTHDFFRIIFREDQAQSSTLEVVTLMPTIDIHYFSYNSNDIIFNVQSI